MFHLLKFIASLGYRVTFLPLSDPSPGQLQTDILTRMGVEVLWGAAGLRQVLRAREGMYDIVIISRPHNALLAMDLVKETNLQARVIYDAEALWHRREQIRRSLGLSPAYPRFEDPEVEFSVMRRADYVMSVSEEAEKEIVEKNLEISVRSFCGGILMRCLPPAIRSTKGLTFCLLEASRVLLPITMML